LKYLKDTVGMGHVESNTVVPYRDLPLAVVPHRRYINHGRTLPAKLDGIANQVLKYLGQLNLITIDGWKCLSIDSCPTFLNGNLQVGERIIENFIAIGGHQFSSTCVDPRVFEKISYQRVHSLGAVNGMLHEDPRFLTQLVVMLSL